MRQSSKKRRPKRYLARVNQHNEILGVKELKDFSGIPIGFLEISALDVGKVMGDMTRMGRPKWRLVKGRAFPV